MDLDHYKVQSSIIKEDENSYQNEGIMDQLKEKQENMKDLKENQEVFYSQNNGSSLNEGESIKYARDSFEKEESKISSQSDNNTVLK